MSASLRESAYSSKTLFLNIRDYPGGVAIWGALPAVYDSTQQAYDRGVHVHARLKEVGPKSIDATYENVIVSWDQHQFIINEASAVSFTMASIFAIEIIALACHKCQQQMLSTGMAAVIPKCHHTCHHCGQLNVTPTPCVLNPLMLLKKQLGDAMVERPSILPLRHIHLSPEKYLGGMQIWGSNPSILWTAKRLEESAIHVHAYHQTGKRVVDNTYSYVTVQGQKLDIEMIRVLQIQQMLPEVMRHLTSIYCTLCGAEQFSQGINAVLLQTKSICQHCQGAFHHTAGISNPAYRQLNEMRTLYEYHR